MVRRPQAWVPGALKLPAPPPGAPPCPRPLPPPPCCQRQSWTCIPGGRAHRLSGLEHSYLPMALLREA